MRLTLAIAAWALLTAGRASAQRVSTPDVRDIAPTVITTAGRLGALDAVRAVIETPEAYRYLWRLLYSGESEPLPPLPPIDFTKDMAILVALGGQGGAVTSVSVPRVREGPGLLEITIVIRTPSTPCLGPAIVTKPAVLVRVPKTVATAVFRDSVVYYRCL